jgi:hypothetical protein
MKPERRKERTTWKAEAWRGAVNVVRYVPATIPLDARELGVTDVREYYGDPLRSCSCCGSPLWHYWEFQRADGEIAVIGSSCATVILGQSPLSFISDARERRQVEEALARELAEIAEQRRWWKAAEQAALRRTIVLGAREEETSRSRSEFYRRAWKSALRGALTPAMRSWIEKLGGDSISVVQRTAKALDQLWDLWMRVRSSMYDAPIIDDLFDREFPENENLIWGPPLSQKQSELIDKLAKRYRKQMCSAQSADAKA